MWFSTFIALHALCVTLVHGSFLPSAVSEYMSSSQKASESSLQESSSSTVESFSQDAQSGFSEFESSATETASAATSSFQESSFVNEIENSGKGLLGQGYKSSQSSSASTKESESFLESSLSTLENFTNGGGSFGQQELSVRASEAAESMRAASESSFNTVESSTGGIFGLNEYASSLSQTAESQQKSSLNAMENFTNNASSGLTEFQSSLSEASESLQESSSNVMERSLNRISDGGLQESESSLTSSKSSSSASTASSNYQQSSMIAGASGFDYDVYANAFNKCKFIPDVERQCYLKWLETFSGDSLNYYGDILAYLSAEKALSEEILDYELFQKEIMSLHQTLTSSGIYDVNADLSTKAAVFDKCRSKLRKASNGLSRNSALYKLLKYSATTDTTTIPCTVGLLNSIIQGQETYFSKSSSTSSTKSSNGVRSAGTRVDTAQYQNVFKAANIAEAESLLYSNYLSELASNNERSFAEMINFFNKNTQVITSDMILDFASLNREIRSVYDSLAQEQFFTSNADWLAKKAKLTELKSKLSGALCYLDKNCCMYQALQYCLEKDVSYIPLFVGLSNYLLEQQSSYFLSSSSVSSSTSVTSTKSGCCC